MSARFDHCRRPCVRKAGLTCLTVPMPSKYTRPTRSASPSLPPQSCHAGDARPDPVRRRSRTDPAVEPRVWLMALCDTAGFGADRAVRMARRNGDANRRVFSAPNRMTCPVRRSPGRVRTGPRSSRAPARSRERGLAPLARGQSGLTSVRLPPLSTLPAFSARPTAHEHEMDDGSRRRFVGSAAPNRTDSAAARIARAGSWDFS